MLTQDPGDGNDVATTEPNRKPSGVFLRRHDPHDGSTRARDRAAVAAAAIAIAAETSPIWETLPVEQGMSEAAGCSVSARRDTTFRHALAVADIFAAYFALLSAITLVGKGAVSLRPTVVLVAPLVVLVSKAIGLYDRDQNVLRKTTIDEVPSILQLSGLYTLAVWFGETLLFDRGLARPQVFLLAGASFVTITVTRSFARRLARELTPPERCIVLGTGADTARIVDKLASSSRVSATLIGRVALRAEDEESVLADRVLGRTGVLAHVIDEHRVERVIIASDSHDQEEILHAIRLSKALGAKVSVLPRLLEVVGSSATYDDVDGVTLLGVRQYGLSKSSGLLKRTMDLVAGTVGIVLLAPLLVVIAIAIKVDSPGPVFFRQPRIGRRGERFDIFKFRSMVPDAEALKGQLRNRNEAEGGLFKITHDPRITRMGRFLRRTSVDELPQLLNVLQGHMSLVGPRPFVPDEDALIEGWERRRLTVRPGMTGLWQIFGSSRIPKAEMVKIDYLYAANWSMWLDLKILLRTVPYILSRRGL
jgi:exopolysaccharide biosynthesis polyprenyl glycosylphosphotransferase